MARGDSSAAGAAGAVAEILQGFLETGSGKEVFEVGVDFVPMSLVPVGDFFAHLDETCEVSLRVSVTRFMVGDDDEAFFQDGGEIGVVHGVGFFLQGSAVRKMKERLFK